MERLARDKHSSLFQKFVTYGGKKFDRIGPWSRSHKNFSDDIFLSFVSFPGRHELFPNKIIPNVKIPNLKIPNRTINQCKNPKRNIPEKGLS
jgi:hypothetical protein